MSSQRHVEVTRELNWNRVRSGALHGGISVVDMTQLIHDSPAGTVLLGEETQRLSSCILFAYMYYYYYSYYHHLFRT